MQSSKITRRQNCQEHGLKKEKNEVKVTHREMSKLPSGIQQHFQRDVDHSVHVTQSPALTDIVGNRFNVSLNR